MVPSRIMLVRLSAQQGFAHAVVREGIERMMRAEIAEGSWLEASRADADALRADAVGSAHVLRRVADHDDATLDERHAQRGRASLSADPEQLGPILGVAAEAAEGEGVVELA